MAWEASRRMALREARAAREAFLSSALRDALRLGRLPLRMRASSLRLKSSASSVPFSRLFSSTWLGLGLGLRLGLGLGLGLG